MMGGKVVVENPELQERINRLIARARNEKRAANVRYDIARIRAKLERIGANSVGLRRERYFFYFRKLQRLEAQLEQIPLPL